MWPLSGHILKFSTNRIFLTYVGLFVCFIYLFCVFFCWSITVQWTCIYMGVAKLKLVFKSKKTTNWKINSERRPNWYKKMCENVWKYWWWKLKRWTKNIANEFKFVKHFLMLRIESLFYNSTDNNSTEIIIQEEFFRDRP